MPEGARGEKQPGLDESRVARVARRRFCLSRASREALFKYPRRSIAVIGTGCATSVVVKLRTSPVNWLGCNPGSVLLKFSVSTILTNSSSKVLADAAKFGATIASDGWSDAQRRPFLNFMVVTRERAAFMHSIDCTDHMADGGRKDSAYVASKTIDAINKFGAKNVVHF